MKTARSTSKKCAAPTESGTYQPPSAVSEWLAALGAPDTTQKPNDDWMTRQQLSELLGLKRCATQEHLRKGVKSGRVEMKLFHIKASNGSAQPIPHYRIIK